MLTVQQVCERLGISKLETVYAYIQSGQLRAVNIATNVNGRPCWRIHPDDLAAFLDARRNPGPSPTATRSRRRRQQEVTEYF